MDRSRLLDFFYRFLEDSSRIKRSEFALVLWSFLYFFFLLSSYYVLRPIRDEMGIQGGVENLPWMFTATFVGTLIVVPVFGWIATNVPKRRIVPVFYSLFLFMLLGFYALMKTDLASQWVPMAFFVWISVFNLFVVSVFWSFMVDVYPPRAIRAGLRVHRGRGDHRGHRRAGPDNPFAAGSGDREPPSGLERSPPGDPGLYRADLTASFSRQPIRIEGFLRGETRGTVHGTGDRREFSRRL